LNLWKELLRIIPTKKKRFCVNKTQRLRRKKRFEDGSNFILDSVSFGCSTEHTPSPSGYYTLGHQGNQSPKCVTCGERNWFGLMVECKDCQQIFHRTCLEVPLEETPKDDWFCPRCENVEMKEGKNRTNVSEKKKQSIGAKATKRWGGGMATAAVPKTNLRNSISIRHFGKIKGIKVGTNWEYRVFVSAVGIHRPPVGGIAGQGNVGAQSIVLSGGYEDDIDDGDEFIYTGAGGRELKEGNKRTAPQSKNQELTKTNLALARNCPKFQIVDGEPTIVCPTKKCKGKKLCAKCEETCMEGKPVRVVRGYPKKKKI